MSKWNNGAEQVSASCSLETVTSLFSDWTAGEMKNFGFLFTAENGGEKIFNCGGDIGRQDWATKI